MMNKINLKFDDKELEKQYQIHVFKYNMKSFIYYLIITMLGQIIMITDFFLHDNQILLYVVLPGTIINAGFIYMIKKKSLVAKYFYIFTFIFSIQGSTLQILFVYINQIRGSQKELQIYLDIIQQFTMMFNFTDNHLIASFLYVYFLATRLYIHFYEGFYTLSLAFIIYGSFYFIDQYQKQKLRRKQFLKTKSNRLLETMIQEFVEDNVCIIEKDKNQIKFNGYLINYKLNQIGTNINKILQKFKIKSLNINLQDYLYKSVQEKEVLICLYKNYSYQVTYQQFPQNKNKIFVKFLCINQNFKNKLNYKMLYQQQSRNLKLLSKTCKEGKQIQNIIKYNNYLYCLEKYFHLYKTKIQNISIQDLKNMLILKKFRITTQNEITNIVSDRNLLIILIQIISDLMNNGFVTFFIDKEILSVEFLGKQIKEYDKTDYIDKILYHIGLQKCIIQYQNDLISIKIQILMNLEKKFQI